MKQKIVSMLTITMLLLGFFAAFQHVSAVTLNHLTAKPTELHFWSDVDFPLDTFTVSFIANVSDATPFFGWQFEVNWTAGMINCTAQTLNMEVWGVDNAQGPWIKPFLGTACQNDIGFYHQSITGAAPGVPVSGIFWLVNLTFVIIQEPGYMEVLHTKIMPAVDAGGGFVAYALLDDGGLEIPHDWAGCDYYYHWAPPSQKPRLEVVPALNQFTGKNINKTPLTFSVDVMIKNVVAGWRLAGTEFLLVYNTTVLDVISVTVGDFFEPFFSVIDPPQTFKWYEVKEGDGEIHVAYAMLDIPRMISPYGEGKVATITFNATLQEKFPTFVDSPLDLQIATGNGMTSFFINFLGEELEGGAEVDGYYKLAGYVIGRVIDVYTQYPDPYGGQGPQAPSDMFWPQKQVELYANVTYNEWPVQQKPVAFEVKNNVGTIMTILTGVTDEFGTAHVSFRMNWPCTDPEDLFGVWTITATVDIACIVVNDTLEFHYDYLVHLVKITTDKTEYGHCENVNFNVTFTSHAQQYYWVYIAGTIHDELNYPVITGTVAEYIKIGGAIFCQPKEYTVSFHVHVDKSVAAGEATIHASALTNPPYAGGCALCPEVTAAIGILAIWAP
jgi:hypothetical protein